MKTVRILGTRGVPAAHGGFETFAERLALFLQPRGWRVVVYCQDVGTGALQEDTWCGIERVRIPVAARGAASSIVFDWRATRHAAQHRDLCLTLGYNTAVFCFLLRRAGVRNAINMDGIEWQRAKWGPVAKLWFWLNERAGCYLGDVLVADHPEIARHLERLVAASKIKTIAYGADELHEVDSAPVQALGLTPGRFLTLIARPEPENSVLEVVKAFSCKQRGLSLVVLGNYDPAHAYQRAVQAAAGSEVRFLGAVYDQRIVQSLRAHSLAYVHGHQVGGTNPSLVEALGAGNAVIAHDNRFNRWVADAGAVYFKGVAELEQRFDALLDDADALAALRAAARQRFASHFTWTAILSDYEQLLQSMLSVPQHPASRSVKSQPSP